MVEHTNLSPSEEARVQEEAEAAARAVVSGYPSEVGTSMVPWAGMDRTMMTLDEDGTVYPRSSAIVHASFIVRRLAEDDNPNTEEELLLHARDVDKSIGWPWHDYLGNLGSPNELQQRQQSIKDEMDNLRSMLENDYVRVLAQAH